MSLMFEVRYISSSANGVCYSSCYIKAASEESAIRWVASLKRKGLTVWCETPDGVFAPVKGAMRSPGSVVRSEPRP